MTDARWPRLAAGALLALSLCLLGLQREQTEPDAPPPTTAAAVVPGPEAFPKSPPPRMSFGERVVGVGKWAVNGIKFIAVESWQGIRTADHWIRDHLW